MNKIYKCLSLLILLLLLTGCNKIKEDIIVTCTSNETTIEYEDSLANTTIVGNFSSKQIIKDYTYNDVYEFASEDSFNKYLSIYIDKCRNDEDYSCEVNPDDKKITLISNKKDDDKVDIKENITAKEFIETLESNNYTCSLSGITDEELK
jgi:hypothetical protein